MGEKEQYMAQALALARQALETGDVPVGCVVVQNGRIVGRGRNRREEKQNALLHAEIEAVDQACQALGRWRPGPQRRRHGRRAGFILGKFQSPPRRNCRGDGAGMRRIAKKFF